MREKTDRWPWAGEVELASLRSASFSLSDHHFAWHGLASLAVLALVTFYYLITLMFMDLTMFMSSTMSDLVWMMFFQVLRPFLTTSISDILCFDHFDIHGLDHVLDLVLYHIKVGLNDLLLQFSDHPQHLLLVTFYYLTNLMFMDLTMFMSSTISDLVWIMYFWSSQTILDNFYY